MSKDQPALSDPLATIMFMNAGRLVEEQFAPAPEANGSPKAPRERGRWRASAARGLHALAGRLEPAATGRVVQAPCE